MEIQNQVSRILRDNLARLRDVLDECDIRGGRRQPRVADRVCEAFDFRDGRDRWQRASCCRALSDLQAAGHVSLPAGRGARGGGGRAAGARHRGGGGRAGHGPRGCGSDGSWWKPTSSGRSGTPDGVRHPRGAGPFVGPQLRYLVGSAHGWLGAVGFAASARRLRSRDAWVGWDDAGRRAHLHRQPAAECAPASCVATWPRTCWAGSSGRSRRRLRGSVWLSPLAAGDVRRRDRTDGGERARGELGSGG